MKMEDMHLSGPDNTKLEVRLQFLFFDWLPAPDLPPVCPGLGP